MNALAWLRSHRRAVAVACGLLLLLALAGVAGSWLHPRVVRVTEYKDRVVTVEHQTIVEKPVIQWRDRVVTRVVYRKDGSKVSETTTTDDSGKATGGRTTTTDETTTHDVDRSDKTVLSPEGRWEVRVLAGANTLGGVVAGAGVEYRLIGPITLGAWATAPVAGRPSGFTVGLSAGLRLP